MMDELQAFDPKQEYAVVYRRLPHWVQSGAVSFITWRTADSMPAEVVKQWIFERDEFLKRAHQSDHSRISWKVMCELTEKWDSLLDTCHGACVLKQRELAQIVAECLLKFDGGRYLLTDFVVMPNHVHVLAAFRNGDAMLRQCANWKRFTARSINEQIGRRGRFWQSDSFDHLVRSPEWYGHYRKYIAENGPRAGLNETEYLWYSKAVEG